MLQSNEELIRLSVKNVVDNLVSNVVSGSAKSEGASKVAGKKCHQYSAAFKAEAINTKNCFGMVYLVLLTFGSQLTQDTLPL